MAESRTLRREREDGGGGGGADGEDQGSMCEVCVLLNVTCIEMTVNAREIDWNNVSVKRSKSQNKTHV